MSPKPWAKVEIGYMDHPKFVALNANAICLWHEGKNYCDKYNTDGLIPKDALKLFRFSSKKSVELLMVPCPTPRPDGTAYAPMWEPHPAGYRMHDYLDHNDCRDEVLERMERADRARDEDRDRKRVARAAKKAKRYVSDRTNAGQTAGQSGDRPTNVLLYTETETETKEQVTSAETRGVSPPPVLTFPTDGDPKTWGLSELQVDEWQQAYSGLAVREECAKALAWVKAGNRKTAGGMSRFLVNWLNRATNRGGMRSSVASPARVPAWAQRKAQS